MVHKTKPEDLKTIGEWSWNSKLLNEKVIKGDINDCWEWQGSRTIHGPLFGVIKNGRRQMTQVCRILYRDWFNEDCEDKEVTHACGNKNCINSNHWEIKPYKRHEATPTKIAQGKLKPIRQVRVKKWWDATE